MNTISKKAARELADFMSSEAKAQQDELHKLIGLYMATWSNVESLLIGLFKTILGVSQANAQILYSGLSSVYARRQTILALAHQNLEPVAAKKVVGVMDRFQTETAIRNQLAHCEYMIFPAGHPQAGMYFATAHWSTENVALHGTSVVERPLDFSRLSEIEQGWRRLTAIYGELRNMIDNPLPILPQ